MSCSRDFNAHTRRGPGIEEQGPLASRALMRRGPGRQPGRLQIGLFRADVIHAQTEMMQARSMLREPGLERMIGRERLDELELHVAEVEMREPNRAGVHDFRIKERKPEAIAPNFQCGLGVRHGDREMIESLELHAEISPTIAGRPLSADR